MLARSIYTGDQASSVSEAHIDELVVSRIDLASFPRLWSEPLIVQLELLVMVDIEANTSKKFEIVDGCWAVIDNCRLVLKDPTASVCQPFEFTFDKIFNVSIEGKILTTLLEVSFKPSNLIGGISMWYDFASPDVYSFREFFEHVLVRRIKDGHAHVFNGYIKPLQYSLRKLTLLAKSLLNQFRYNGIDHLKICENLKAIYASTINLGLPERKVQLGSTGGANSGISDMDLPKVASEHSEPVKMQSVPSFSQKTLALFQKLRNSTVQSDLSAYTMLVTQVHCSIKGGVTQAEEEYFSVHGCKKWAHLVYQSLSWQKLFEEYKLDNKDADPLTLLESVSSQ